MSKKIMVTGGAGYIGSITIANLIDHGYNAEDIHVVDNLSTGNRSMIPRGTVFHNTCISNVVEIKNIISEYKIEALMHFAASAYVGESIENPNKYFRNNVVNGCFLLESLIDSSCNNIVFSSSCAVYGNSETNNISEEHNKKPENPYGESKLIFENILKWYSRRYNFKYAILRYFNAGGAAYGIGEMHNPETHIIPLFIRAILSGEFLYVYGTDYKTADGSCIRDYTHVEDIAEAHFQSLNKLNGDSFEINIGTGLGSSVLEIIARLEVLIGKTANIKYLNRRDGDPDSLISNPSRANSLISWQAKKGLDDILKSALEWELK